MLNTTACSSGVRSCAYFYIEKETDMTNVTVKTRNGSEEVAGKSFAEVCSLARRLGHGLPHKSGKQNGVWINTYKLKAA